MPGHEPLPRLTDDIPGVGGRIKDTPTDFQVEEIPLYEPSGRGTHVYFRVRKTGLTTMSALQMIARALGVPKYEIGFAGLKDAHALTIQTFSLEHIEPSRLERLHLPGLEIVSISRHTNKLRLGHLAGNRFTIRIRGVDVSRLADVRAVLARGMDRGLPNYFGPQRFGTRGDTWQIGEAILRGDYATALAIMLGRPAPADHGPVAEARRLYDAGDYAAAAETWPYPFSHERRICRAMAQSRGNAARAFRFVDRNLQRLYVSAFQSHLFNLALARRIQAIDRLWPGDLAWRHPQGAVFAVEDIEREQIRCRAFEISPTGPIFGHRMRRPEGEQAALETSLLQELKVAPEDWNRLAHKVAQGTRRPLRLRPHEASADTGRDEHGDYIELRFWLESGCYATSVLREICKSDPLLPPAPDTHPPEVLDEE